MAFNKKELKRRPWTEEEKKITMKNCANRCACCGQKLTFKTLTMEHVVPFSKGGGNAIENLVALCSSCNRAKSNMLYLPETFYMALNSSHLHTVSKYFRDWFNETFTTDDLIEKPLLYEGMSAYITMEGTKTPTFKNGCLVPSLIMDVFELNQFNLKDYIDGLNITKKDIFDSVVDPDKLFALYAAKQRTSDTISSLFTVQLINEKSIIITEIYSRNEKSLSTISTLIIAVNAKYYNDNNIYNIIFMFKSEKAMKGLIKSITHNAFCSVRGSEIPKFTYGYGEDIHIQYNGKDIAPQYGVGIGFPGIIADAIDNAKDLLK